MLGDLNIENIERRRNGFETKQPQHSRKLEIIHTFREKRCSCEVTNKL